MNPAFVKTLDDNAQNLAGALGFKDTTELWDLYLHDDAAKPVLEAYVAHRKDRFGAEEGALSQNDCRILDTTISQLILDPSTRAIWIRPDCPTLDTSGITPVTFFAVVTLWYAVELIAAKPTLFDPATRPRASPPSFDPYDIIHAWKLLGFFYRHDHGEAEIAICLAKVIMQYCRDVLIISPYKAQVALAAQKWEAT